MTIRCILDGLMLPAVVRSAQVPPLVAFEGGESFPVEAVEALLYYEMVSATRDEVLALEGAKYRMLRPAEDFQLVPR